ncbi:MAG: hypothetical protein QXP53_00315 [Candidatus Pacearchaeota archaeon]
MKRGLFNLLTTLLISVLSLNSALAQPFSLTNLLSNEWFNAALLFLLVFAICFLVLKKVFASSMGVAVIISFVLGVAGSFSIIAKYGLIFEKFDWWVVFIVFIIIVALLMLLSKRKKAATIMLLFVIPVAWFALGQEALCPPQGTLPSNACTFLNVLMGILILIALWMLIRTISKKVEEKGAWEVMPEEKRRAIKEISEQGKAKKIKFKFWATRSRIKKSESSTLLWKTENAVQFSINSQSLPLSGRLNVIPNTTTTYFGTAIGKDGKSVTKKVTIYVEGASGVPPQPPSKPRKTKGEPLAIHMQIKGTEVGPGQIAKAMVKRGEKIKIKVWWSGGTPPYDAELKYGNITIGNIRHDNAKSLQRTVTISEASGAIVGVEASCIDSDWLLKNCSIELKVTA